MGTFGSRGGLRYDVPVRKSRERDPRTPAPAPCANPQPEPVIPDEAQNELGSGNAGGER
jgi:hypothetical protein